ncbi:MAG: hypothetical protein ABF741_12065 [Liquorilactobacillus ghanensis]|uniref:hypothetical protein n=1 Tax=Liquorilactobacillus ghanensis TaxID=399370 RepID=UPI0039EC5C78
MAKKYHGRHSRPKHTYQFYKERQNDPKWKNDFIEARSKQRKSIVVKSLAVLTVICVATFFAFRQSRANNDDTSTSSNQSRFNQNRSSNQDSQKSNTLSSNTAQQSSHSYSSESGLSSSTSKTSSSETSSTTNNITTVKIFLQSGFEIMPILYNDEDVSKAMDEGKAPQNTVHDGLTLGYLKNDSIARMSSMGAAYDQPYKITESTLTIGDFKFNYSENGNYVTFDTYEKSYTDGSTITWQLSSCPGAKDSVDSASVQN